MRKKGERRWNIQRGVVNQLSFFLGFGVAPVTLCEENPLGPFGCGGFVV